MIIVSACRTPIGIFGGAVSEYPSVKLGELVIREAIDRAGLSVDRVDHVLMGCVLQAGLGQNIARQCAVKAGIPVSYTAEVVLLHIQ